MADWHLTGRETLAQLLRLSHNDRRKIRDAAQAALLQHPRGEVIPQLVVMLADERPKARNAALDMLVRMNAREAIPDLLEVFSGAGTALARYYALLALDRLQATEVRPLLARAAQHDADAGVRQLAAGMLGKNPAAAPADNSPDEKAVLDTLRAGEPASCWGAGDAVLALRLTGAVPLLLDLLAAPHPNLQVKVAYTLARLGASETIPRLRGLLMGSDSADVVAAAANCLQMLGDPEAESNLLATLALMNARAESMVASPARWNQCDQARWAIVGSLTRLRAVTALPQIIPLLVDPEERLWREARAAVLQIGDETAVGLLATFEQELTQARQLTMARRVTKVRRE